MYYHIIHFVPLTTWSRMFGYSVICTRLWVQQQQPKRELQQQFTDSKSERHRFQFVYCFPKERLIVLECRSCSARTGVRSWAVFHGERCHILWLFGTNVDYNLRQRPHTPLIRPNYCPSSSTVPCTAQCQTTPRAWPEWIKSNQR